MRDREYDIAFLEIKMRNDILEREWLLHKMGRRAEVLLNASRKIQEGRSQEETPNTQSYP